MAYAPARPATPRVPVRGDLLRRQFAERYGSDSKLVSLPIRRPQTEPGDDLVRSPGEPVEHRLRLACVSRLAENRAVEHDDRVDAQHGRVAPVDGASLARQLDRVVADLLVARRLDTERDPQLPRIARRCGEVEARTIIR